MKLKEKILIIVLITVLTLVSYQKLHPGSVKSTGLEIKVDPRIELINVVLTYTKWPYYGKMEEPGYEYIEDMKKYFDPYKNHEAIRWCNDFPLFQDISFPPQMMIYLTDPPDMKLKYEVPETIPEEAVNSCLKTVDFLNKFAADSQFNKFWNSKQSFYAELIGGIKERLPYDTYTSIVSQFYGGVPKKYVCIATPTLSDISFGASLELDTGTIPYFVAGPDEFVNGKPIFTDEWLRLLIFHEYGHSFVNPLCEKYRDEISRYEYLFQYFKASEYISKVYDEWFVIVHEHIVRAGEYVLLKKAGLKKESQANLQKNMKYGFLLLPSIIEKLEYYDSNRNKYPDFEAFFPELIKVFNEIDINQLKQSTVEKSSVLTQGTVVT